jgi:primosomal protein N' (replication factor Y) (superfamily II helicase)
MTESYCNVALQVPLRTTFTYAVPEELRAQVQPGSRVLVPFRKKSLVGVILEMTSTVPEGTKIREIQKVVDLVPALTPILLELGQWIASYYLAPVGEVFRAMLPPVTELAVKRQIVLTEAGRTLAQRLQDGSTLTDLDGSEAGLLQKLLEKKGELALRPGSKLGITPESSQRMQRRGYLEIRETVQGRKRKTQQVVAWKGGGSSRGKAGRERRANSGVAGNRARSTAQVTTPEAGASLPGND